MRNYVPFSLAPFRFTFATPPIPSRLLALGIISLLLGSPPALSAQPGVISGEVMDGQGAPLPGVTVSAGGGRSSVTDARGEFRLDLPAGDHDLTFRLDGFDTVVRPEVQLRAGGETKLEVTLSPATVHEEILVTGEAPFDTSPEAVDRVELERLPAARDPWGIWLSTLGEAPKATLGEAPEGVTIGPTAHENPFLIDGIVVNSDVRGTDVFDHYDFGVIVGNPVTGVSAEYGRFTGGVLNVITKTGGNRFSGSIRSVFADEGSRSDLLPGGTAAPGEEGGGQPTLEIELEETLGGYCLRDRLWFFAAGRPEAGEASPPLEYPGSFPGSDPPEAPEDFFESIDIYDIDGDGRPDLRIFSIPGCDGEPGLGFATNVPSHLLVGPDGVEPVDMNPWSSGSPIEDPEVPSSSFYLSGSYSILDEGFRLDPQQGDPAADPISPDIDGIFLFGYSGSSLLEGISNTLPDVDGDGIGDPLLIDPNHLRRFCPDLIGGPGLIGGFLRLGEGGTLDPDTSVQIDCPFRPDASDFFKTASSNHELKFGTGNLREPEQSEEDTLARERLRKLDPSFDDITPRVGFTLDVAGDGRSRLYGHFGSFYESMPLNNLHWRAGTYSERKDPLQDGGFSFPPSRSTDRSRFEDLVPPAVLDAPLATGIQDVGVQFRSALGDENTKVERQVPGGAVVSDGPFPLLHFVAKGGSTGEVFDVEIVHPAGGPVPVEGYLAIEPVAVDAGARARIEAELAAVGGVRETVTAAGYCLQFMAAAPPAGTILRVAGAEEQRAFAPVARALEAADRLREAGLLNPDTNPESYFHSIRQWSVWMLEQGFEAETFVEAFVEHTKKNLSEAGREWTEQIEAVVRNSADGRWKDVTRVLETARGLQ